MEDYRELVNKIFAATRKRRTLTENTPAWQCVIVKHDESCMAFLNGQCDCEFSLSINGEFIAGTDEEMERVRQGELEKVGVLS